MTPVEDQEIRLWYPAEGKEIRATPSAIIREAQEKCALEVRGEAGPATLHEAASLLGYSLYHPTVSPGTEAIRVWHRKGGMALKLHPSTLYDAAWKRWAENGRNGPEPFTLEEVMEMLPEYDFGDAVTSRLLQHASKSARDASESWESLSDSMGEIVSAGLKSAPALIMQLVALGVFVAIVAAVVRGCSG